MQEVKLQRVIQFTQRRKEMHAKKAKEIFFALYSIASLREMRFPGSLGLIFP
jgi:hypothetical protein